MKNSDKKFIQNWKLKRKKGRLNYALTHGPVFGIFIFIFSNFPLLANSSFKEVYFSRYGLIYLMITLLGGVIGYYTLMWWLYEYLFQKKSRKTKS